MIVDSITVGSDRSLRLQCLSLATSGYAFHPTTLKAAMRHNEHETVLGAGQRARQRPAIPTSRRVSEKIALPAMRPFFFVCFFWGGAVW